MRELVQDQISAVRGIGCAAFRFVPRQHERSHPTAGVTEATVFALLPDVVAEVAVLVRDVSRWINENGCQLRVVIRLAMQQKKARLRGDSDTDLVGEFKSTATFEVFFREEDLHATKKLCLIRRRKAAENWNVARDDRFPR